MGDNEAGGEPFAAAVKFEELLVATTGKFEVLIDAATGAAVIGGCVTLAIGPAVDGETNIGADTPSERERKQEQVNKIWLHICTATIC